MKLFTPRKHSVKQNITATAGDQLLQTGVPAPDFSLPSTVDGELTLRKLQGRPVILAFYPADWSPVCGDQLTLYNQVLSMFEDHDAQLLGISVDGIWSHRAYAADRGLTFPLLADFEPKGRVSQLYGTYNEKKGSSLRSLYVLDAKGVIQWRHRSPPGTNPGADGILNALEILAPKGDRS
jgi:peroxiredoxin